MATKRIDQLTAHPRSAANPLNNATEFMLRDSALASDNTRKSTLASLRSHSHNVLDYGADNSGSVDSTAAFQAAINACTQGGICYVPRGAYTCTGPITLRQGCLLMGDGPQWGSYINQPDGVNDNLFVLETDGAGYCHGLLVENLQLLKNGGNTTTDTLGSGIYSPNNCGENTKFHNVKISGFPEYGIYVAGAITCYFQDLSLFGNGNVGLALANEAGKGFMGHYCLGISGDGNGWKDGSSALIGVYGASAWITGVKAENHNYALEIYPYDKCYVLLSEVTQSHFGGSPPGVVHIAGSYGGGGAGDGGAIVAIQGLKKHGNSYMPAALIVDTYAGRTVAWGTYRDQLHTIYSSAHGVLFSANYNAGCWSATATDPADTINTFALGHTNGVGTGTTGSLQAKPGGTTAPTSLTAAKWVRARLDGVDGWIPFFT
jgi:hypothetical protein